MILAVFWEVSKEGEFLARNRIEDVNIEDLEYETESESESKSDTEENSSTDSENESFNSFESDDESEVSYMMILKYKLNFTSKTTFFFQICKEYYRVILANHSLEV